MPYLKKFELPGSTWDTFIKNFNKKIFAEIRKNFLEIHGFVLDTSI